MSDTTTLLAIARRHLGITTFKRQWRDHLDFHEVGVWNVEAALKAAFEAGRASATDPGRGEG